MSATSAIHLPACRVIHAGTVAYQEAWEWQRRLVAARSAGRCPDTLLLLEHPPTITLGRASHREHILTSDAELTRQGVALVESDRGGDVTYHAPGQLVGYPILKLSRHGGNVLGYLRKVEETMICALAHYGVEAGRVEGLTGVWVALPSREPAPPGNALLHHAKVAAIGVRLSASGVTSHGFALNVAPDMRGFAHIIPCGLRGRQVISLEALLGSAPPIEEVAGRVVACFANIFGVAPFAANIPSTEQEQEHPTGIA